MQTIKEKISANIAKYRKKENLSQKDLAAKLQTKPSTVSSWEQGVSTPNAEMIVEMCNLFHISVDVMYGMSLADAKKAIESETVFLNYLLSLGYEYVDTFWDNDYGYDRCIHIISENKDIPLTKEEYENLKRNIKNDIDLEIERLRQYKRI